MFIMWEIDYELIAVLHVGAWWQQTMGLLILQLYNFWFVASTLQWYSITLIVKLTTDSAGVAVGRINRCMELIYLRTTTHDSQLAVFLTSFIPSEGTH